MIPKLPASGRMTKKLKKRIVSCLVDKQITIAKCMEIYDLSFEEIQEWIRKSASGQFEAKVRKRFICQPYQERI